MLTMFSRFEVLVFDCFSFGHQGGMNFLRDHSGNVFGPGRCTLKDLQCNKEAFLTQFLVLATLATDLVFLSFAQAVQALCSVKMGRSRPELVSLAVRQYSQDCRLLPFGITMDMPCAEAWGLKQAYALLKLVACLH